MGREGMEELWPEDFKAWNREGRGRANPQRDQLGVQYTLSQGPVEGLHLGASETPAIVQHGAREHADHG